MKYWTNYSKPAELLLQWRKYTVHFVSSSKKEHKLKPICSADFSCVTVWLNKPLSTRAEIHHDQKSWSFACEIGPPPFINWTSKEALRLILCCHYLFCLQIIICPQHRGTTYIAKLTAPQTTLLMLFFELCRMASSSAAIWLNYKHLNGAMWEVWCNSLILHEAFQLFCTVTALHTYARGPSHLHLMQNYSLPRRRACESQSSLKVVPLDGLLLLLVVLLLLLLLLLPISQFRSTNNVEMN